jgi:hypothetical protein
VYLNIGCLGWTWVTGGCGLDPCVVCVLVHMGAGGFLRAYCMWGSLVVGWDGGIGQWGGGGTHWWGTVDPSSFSLYKHSMKDNVLQCIVMYSIFLPPSMCYIQVNKQ